MSYRCGHCKSVVKHGISMLRHTTYRRLPSRIKAVSSLNWQGKQCWEQVEEPGRTEIATETPVCEGCADFLAKIASGRTLQTVLGEK